MSMCQAFRDRLVLRHYPQQLLDVVTLDRRDFSVYRVARNKTFSILP